MARVGSTVEVVVMLKVLQCASCSILFGVPEDMDNRRKADGKKFFCPQGHENIYGGETMDMLRQKIKGLEADLKKATTPPTRAPVPDPGTSRGRVLALVATLTPKVVNVAYVASTLRIHKTTAARALKDLVESGLIQRNSANGFAYVSDGDP